MTDKDCMTCEECGEAFNPAEMDQVIYHCFGHELRLATGIVGDKREEQETGTSWERWEKAGFGIESVRRGAWHK